jgi:short-subunit dehydrogenase
MKIFTYTCILYIIYVTSVTSQTCITPIAPPANYSSGIGVNLDGYTVLISGSSSNLSMGREAVKLYKSLGARVFSFARTPRLLVDNLSELEGMGSEYMYGDVTKPGTLQSMKSRLIARGIRKIDIIFNAAGISYFGNVNDMRVDQAQQVTITNSLGAVNVWLVFKDMMTSNSTFGFVSPQISEYLFPYMATYSASYVALERSMQHIAMQNAQTNIKFVSVVSAEANTNILINALRPDDPLYPELDKRIYGKTLTLLTTEGQSASRPSQALLQAHISDAKPGQYTRVHSNTGGVQYTQYTFLSQAYLSRQPQQAIQYFEELSSQPE